MQNSSRCGRRALGRVVVAILRLACEGLPLAADDALDEPLSRHQRHVLRHRPPLQRRRAGGVRHHHIVPAGGGKLWEREREWGESEGGGKRSARGEGGRGRVNLSGQRFSK